jgi:hypothetical protein
MLITTLHIVHGVPNAAHCYRAGIWNYMILIKAGEINARHNLSDLLTGARIPEYVQKLHSFFFRCSSHAVSEADACLKPEWDEHLAPNA